MKPGALEGMRDKVLFHNADLAALFLLAQFPLLRKIRKKYQRADPSRAKLKRLNAALSEGGEGLVVLGSFISFVFLFILLIISIDSYIKYS